MWPQIKAQAATGKPIWDVVDTPTSNCLRGGREGLLEKLDFAKLPNAAAMPEKYRTPYSVAYEFYSTVIGYNKKTLKKTPQSWADFWNVKAFPGTRALRNDPQTVLEAALLADGVSRDKLYPLDVDRAFKKLQQIKPDITVWWTSGGQSAQLLHDGEVDMTMIWNGRASARAQGQPRRRFHFQRRHSAKHAAMRAEERAESERRDALPEHRGLARVASESAALYRLRSGQSGCVQDRQDRGEARERVAEFARERREAGIDVRRLVGIGCRHSGESALAQVHAITGGVRTARLTRPRDHGSSRAFLFSGLRCAARRAMRRAVFIHPT